MRKAATKALYLFLCAILGMVLFAMLHRAIFVLYDLLIFVDSMYAFGFSEIALATIDFFALVLALFLGGWYGTMIGIDWYAMVYGPNAEIKPGMFHGFIPHKWRGVKSTSKMAAATARASAPAATSTTVKVRAPEAVKESVKPPVREWTFDDLIAPSNSKLAKPVAKRKAAVRKTAVKKATRKPAKSKIDKSESVE